MSKANRKIEVLDTSVNVTRMRDADFISLTDIARHRNADRSDDLIRNWVRNRNTLEFLGIWERIHNPDFNSVEFDGFRIQAGLNSFGNPNQRSQSQAAERGTEIMKQAQFSLRGHNPDVLTCIANLSNDEVFTPPAFANRMLDTLVEAWASSNDGANIWEDKSATFLDPCTKCLSDLAQRRSRESGELGPAHRALHRPRSDRLIHGTPPPQPPSRCHQRRAPMVSANRRS